MPKIGKIKNQQNSVSVSDNYRLHEIDSTFPPIDGVQNIQIYVQPLTLNNDGVTTSMKVNGSVTPQEFYISAENGFDVYINSISFFIAAELTIADLGEFAGITTPLTNGCQLIYQNRVEVVIGDNLKTNYDMLRMSVMNPNFGLVSSEAFKVIQAFSNQDDGYFFIIKFADYGYETDYSGGLKLNANSNDKIVFKIRDNLNLTPSEISTFNAICYGYKVKV